MTTEQIASTSDTVSRISTFINNKNNEGKFAIFKYDEAGCNSDDVTTEEDKKKGLTKTLYTFDRKTVEAKFQNINFEELGETQLLYFHGIFQTYTLENKIEVSESGDIYDWYDIRNFVFPKTGTWSSDEVKNNFYQYYNREIYYTPIKQPVQVVYRYDYLEKDASDDTEEIVVTEPTIAGQKFFYDGIKNVEKLTDSNGTTEFEYQSCTPLIYSNQSWSYDSSYEEDKFTLKKSGDSYSLSAIVPSGGLYILVNYKEVPKNEPIYIRRLYVEYTSEDSSAGFKEEEAIILQKKNFVENARLGGIYKWNVAPYYIYDGTSGAEADTANVNNETVYKLRGKYITDLGTGKKREGEHTPGTLLSNITNGSTKVVEGGIMITFLYVREPNGKMPIYFTRELETSTGTFSLVSPTLIDCYDIGYRYSWSAKKYLQKNGDMYLERTTISTDEDVTTYELKRVEITDNASGSILQTKTLGSGATRISGNQNVSGVGYTIHYIYKPIFVPDTTPTPTPKPEVPEPIVPESHTLPHYMATPTAVGILRADRRGEEKFTATQGVATTESLFAEIQGTKYLISYTLEKRTGVISYTVPIVVKGNLVWTNMPNSASGKILMKEPFALESFVTIKRAYGYWEITHLDYYVLDYAEVSNYALPNGSVTIPLNTGECSLPAIHVVHSDKLDDHVLAPIEIRNGQTLEFTHEDVDGGFRKPLYPSEDMTYEAHQKIGQVTVINDYLMFDGDVILSNVPMELDTGWLNASQPQDCFELCNKNALYKDDFIIDKEKLNGTYPSSGMLFYRRVSSINSNYAYDTIPVPIKGLNKVVIHTPVVCNPVVRSDNDKYVQLIHPTEDCTELVLDEDETLNDFTVQISNYGDHHPEQGYYFRDFSFNLYDGPQSWNVLNTYIKKNSSDVLRNEVKFPFDVYMYQGNGTKEYVKKNTWITIGKSIVRFHLPMWVNEGVYTVDCRTVAANCRPEDIDKTQYFSNALLENYVATNQFNVEVSGRIYGMNVYDLTDYPIWEDTFRVKDSLEFKINHKDEYQSGVNQPNYSADFWYNYTAGIKNQYGDTTDRLPKYTFPLVDGSHPKFTNVGVLKKGYCLRFSLETVGSMYSNACSVVLKPSFWFVDRTGGNRTRVDIYYNEDINGKFRQLVKIGSTLDQANVKMIQTGDRYLGIPMEEQRATAALRNMSYAKFAGQYDIMNTFSNIMLGHTFRTLTNQDYTRMMQATSGFSEVERTGITAADLDVRKQKWYGEWYLPGSAMAVKAGFDVRDYASKYGVDYREDFWLTDGYIIVNFDIYTVDQNGNQRLSYANADNFLSNGNCCMWEMEGQQLQKTDYYQTTFDFRYGDIIIFDGTNKVSDDYSVDGYLG